MSIDHFLLNHEFHRENELFLFEFATQKSDFFDK